MTAPESDTLTACGISWDHHDIARFLMLTRQDGKHLVWAGAKSRGRGNTAWYGSFSTKGKAVRAHKFYAVAILGLRPRFGIDHLDHGCPDSLCVSCISVVPEWVNLALRWIRVQVGLDEDKIRDAIVDYGVRKGYLPEPDFPIADMSFEDALLMGCVTNDNRWRYDPAWSGNYLQDSVSASILTHQSGCG